MATPEEIQNQKKLNDELQETRDLVFDIKNAYGALSNDSEKLFNASIAGQKNLDKETKKYFNGIAKEVTKNLKGQRYETDEINKLIDKQSSGALKLKDVNAALEKAKQRQQSIEDNIKEAIIEGVISEEKIVELRKESNAQYERQKKLLKELTKEAERQEKALGITYKIFDGISKIPILNSLVKVEKVKEAMEDAAGEGKNTWSVFSTGVSSTFAQIGKSLSDPLVVVSGIAAGFTMLVKTVLELDKHLTDFAKNMSMSKDAANELGANFDQMSYNVGQYSKNLTAGTFSIKNQMQATGELNEALGTAELFTGKMVAGQILLTKRLGLSNEEAAEFAKFSLLTNKSQEKLTVEIGDQIAAFKRQTGVQLNMKKVMQDVAKVSGALSANLGNDPKRIAAAVMQAQKLGITLEQSRKISSSLLDFESSIQNELEAELLTGKNLNFERARALALQGKTTEAAADLLEQVGGLSEFQKLNIIQQDAIAKSIGMSADEMADAYKQQELLKGTAFATKEAFLEQYRIAEQHGELEKFKATVQQAANGEQLLAMGAQQSAQEKFQEAIDKLKETFARIAAGPLLHMVEKFANFVSNAENLKGIMDTIKYVIDAIAIAIGGKLVVGLASAAVKAGIFAASQAAGAAATLATVSAVTLGLGAVAVGAGLAYLISEMNSGVDKASEKIQGATKLGDGVISPSGGLLISGPKGSFITDPADQIVAAPNAASMIGGGGGGISRADIDAIANRPIAVNVQANTDTLLRLQTAQSQYGAPNSFA
jgi:hypothetical protein